MNPILVGVFDPFEKYARQIGSFHQGSGVKIKKYLKPPPRYSPCQMVVKNAGFTMVPMVYKVKYHLEQIQVVTMVGTSKQNYVSSHAFP